MSRKITRRIKLEPEMRAVAACDQLALERFQMLDAMEAEDWDRQIEEAAKSGQLAKLYKRLTGEGKRLPMVDLNDFLNGQKRR